MQRGFTVRLWDTIYFRSVDNNRSYGEFSYSDRSSTQFGFTLGHTIYGLKPIRNSLVCYDIDGSDILCDNIIVFVIPNVDVIGFRRRYRQNNFVARIFTDIRFIGYNYRDIWLWSCNERNRCGFRNARFIRNGFNGKEVVNVSPFVTFNNVVIPVFSDINSRACEVITYYGNAIGYGWYELYVGFGVVADLSRIDSERNDWFKIYTDVEDFRSALTIWIVVFTNSERVGMSCCGRIDVNALRSLTR